MAQAELPRPGVEVIQELRTVSPTIVTPTLVPCVVGVCKQIIEVLKDDGTINSDAVVAGPAIAKAPTAETYNVNALTLQVRINDGVIQTFTFAGNGKTAAELASQINSATPAPVDFLAYEYDDGVSSYLQLRTTGTGNNRTIQIVGGTALSVLGWSTSVGVTYYGVGSYIQDAVYLPQTSLPDPRGIMEELDIDEDSIRVFLNLGTEIREILDSESFLRNGTGASAEDDGDGDATTPFVDLGVNLSGSTDGAQLDGLVDLSTPVYVHNMTLAVQLNGGGIQKIKFVGNPLVSTDSTAGGGWTFPHTSNFTFTINGQTGIAAAVVAAADIAAIITQINAAVNAAVGYDIAYRSDVDGNDAPAGNYIGLCVGANPDSRLANTEVIVTADSLGEVFTGLPLRHMLEGDWAGKPTLDIEAQIDAVMGAGFASIEASPLPLNHLRLASATAGAESKIEVNRSESTAACLTALFNLLTPAYTATGTPFKARAGDSVYGDGTFLGNITEVHPLGNSGWVRLNQEVSKIAVYATWYIVAKNLDTVPTIQWGSIVPIPDFYVDTQGNIHVKHDFLRDVTGVPISTVSVGLYISYSALRLDVTPDAQSPGLLRFGTYAELEAALAPIRPDNPLAYGLYCAIQNCGDAIVTGVGVPEVSADKPDGTIEGYAKVWDFLESQEIYSLSLLTHDSDIISAAKVHVNGMSEPAEKGERVLIFHQGTPTREVDTIVSSGTDGDRIGTGPAVFDTKDPLLSQMLLAQGIDPYAITVADSVFVDVAADNYNWNVTGAITNGTEVTVNTTFLPGQNDDNFYAVGTFPAVISETYSVKIRGSVITDKADEIATIIARGQGWANRRLWMLQFDKVGATVEGVDQLVEGYFAAAAVAGMVAGYVPSAPFTNVGIAGFTRITGSNERYSNSQMNQAAAGGADWVIQEGSGAPLVSRHQLTTDLTSIETREQSIVRAVDYCAKFIRTGLRMYIGKFNITQAFIDTLSAVVQGQLRWLADNDVIAGADLNNIIQDADNPDTVLVDVTLEVLYPCNYIRVTLVI